MQKNLKNNVGKTWILGLALMLCAVSIATFANAQTAAESSCDPEYYNTLKSRAWLEAQREITQNQNLIFKPDSVLEYTCFDQYLNVLAQQAENMFSESGRWGDGAGERNTIMDVALENLVGTPVAAYIAANFEDPGYDLAGGRAEGIDHDIAPVAGGTYECDIMNQVWMFAKCMDFIADAEHDGFFTFADYQTGDDKRFLPAQCDAISDRWGTELAAALGTAEETPWTEDPLVTYFNLLLPPADLASDQDGPPAPLRCNNYTPVPTGVTVIRNQSPSYYEEKICLVPGCVFVPGENGAAGTCENS